MLNVIGPSAMTTRWGDLGTWLSQPSFYVGEVDVAIRVRFDVKVVVASLEYAGRQRQPIPMLSVRPRVRSVDDDFFVHAEPV